MQGGRLFPPPQMPIRAEALQNLELFHVTTSTAELQSLLPALPCLTALKIFECEGGEDPGNHMQGPIDTLE